MRLNQFEFLVALKKYGSFTKVAKALLISQPSISRAIKELEEELRYVILKRGKNGVEFTSEGELLLEKAKSVMEEINNIKDIKSIIERDLQWKVRIGTSSHFCGSVLLEVLMGLKTKYPNFVIKSINNDNVHIIKDVATKELDIGLIQINTVDEVYFLDEIEKNSITFIELFSEDMCFIVGQGHPLADKVSVKMHEILQFPYVTTKRSIDSILSFFRKYGYNKEFVQINDVSALRKFLAMSNATALISKNAAIDSNMCFQNKVVALSISDFKLRSRMGWIHNNNDLSSTKEIIIKELTDHCRQYR